MNDICYNICDTQGNIYEYAAMKGYDMEIFSNKYLLSNFCDRAMDTKYSRFQLEDVGECWDFIYPEIGDQLKTMEDNLHFDSNVAYWIGFMYRHLFLGTSVKSKVLSAIIPFDRIFQYYPGLHTIDEDMALDIVCSDFSLEQAYALA